MKPYRYPHPYARIMRHRTNPGTTEQPIAELHFCFTIEELRAVMERLRTGSDTSARNYAIIDEYLRMMGEALAEMHRDEPEQP